MSIHSSLLIFMAHEVNRGSVSAHVARPYRRIGSGVLPPPPSVGGMSGDPPIAAPTAARSALLGALLIFAAGSAAGQQPGQAPAGGAATAWPLGSVQNPAPACVSGDPRVEVLLLGSYHMANPGLDAFNLEADDVLVPERQREIAALVNRLAAFAPTRVAIEAERSDSATWLDAFAAYRTGTRSLQRNEREQIGFRLAAQLGHERIYPIDVSLGLRIGALAEVARSSTSHQGRLAEMQSFGAEALQTMAAWLAEGSISDMLYRMNQPVTLDLAHMPYMDFVLPVNTPDNPVGAELVATWYRRNLLIFANLLDVVADRQDRILVIYGQGHIPLLKQFTGESRDLCLIDPLPFLIDER